MQRERRLTKVHRKGLHASEPKDECPLCARDREQEERQRNARPLLHAYAREWVERYQGTGGRGCREETRAEYRALLVAYALRFFPPETFLDDVHPKHISEFIAWLVKQPGRNGRTLSDKSIRNPLGPLRACMATAKREGDIPENPVVGAALPHGPRIEEDEDLPRPFPRIEGQETMEAVVGLVHADHRLMFELLAATGLRRSELLALEVRHLALDGLPPCVHVRQRTRWQKGAGQVIGPLKSHHARQDLPIPLELADRLRARVAGRGERELLFASPETGRPYDPHHLHLRVLKPACVEAGVEWAGFHTFRHTVASRMFARRAHGGPGAALARPPLGRVHAGALHPPARPGRPRRGTRASPGQGKGKEPSGNDRKSGAARIGGNARFAGLTPNRRKQPQLLGRVRIPVAVLPCAL
jgi:integrase